MQIAQACVDQSRLDDVWAQLVHAKMILPPLKLPLLDTIGAGLRERIFVGILRVVIVSMPC
jgi:hypothetical protein